MFIKLASLALTGLIGMGASTISTDGNSLGQYNSPPTTSTTVVVPATITPLANQTNFPPRTIKTVKWTGTICSNEVTKQDYTMHLVSREEIQDAVNKAGFTGDANRIMVALAYAEGQGDLSCESDWDLANSKWLGSIGLWQVRSLKAETGKGTCRDIEELKKLDIYFQARCAYEISGNGKNNFRPWAAYTRGLYKRYL